MYHFDTLWRKGSINFQYCKTFHTFIYISTFACMEVTEVPTVIKVKANPIHSLRVNEASPGKMIDYFTLISRDAASIPSDFTLTVIMPDLANGRTMT